ncbi:MAG: hypothetical protein WBP93_13245 [Pyrinomonadaceae bacterium]
MEHRQEVRSWSIGRILICLIAMLLLPVACNKDSQADNPTPSQNSQPNNNVEVKQAVSRDNQNSNQVEANKATNLSSPPVNNKAKPSIQITGVPHKGPGGPDDMDEISGTVIGVKFSEYTVVIYAHSDTWYVEPYIASPYTSIGSDGKWKNDTHLGTEYAALLVKPPYKPLSPIRTLPTVGGPVLAIAKVDGK